MERRTLSFLITVTLVFVGLITIQTIFFPPKIDVGNQQDAEAIAQQQDETAESDDEATDDSTPGSESESVEQDTAESSDDASDDENTDEEPSDELPRQFINLGSLYQDSPYSMLACFDTRGAIVRRVEMNSRKRNGRLRYRDVENRYGYIGELELANLPDGGCEVRSVGRGTPADLAQPVGSSGLEGGLKVGDHLLQFDGKPIVSATDFNKMLQETDPGDEITLSVRRTGDAGDFPSVDFRLTAMQRPMQVIRPMPSEQLRMQDLMRRSFQLTLKQQKEAADGQWLQGGWQDIDDRMRSANWDVEVLEIDGQSAVEFTFDIPDSLSAGGIQVVKRYSLPKRDSSAKFDRSYHINLEFEFRNLSDQPKTLNYELAGPTGSPIEGWWYQQKIHGSTWAIGRMAGARDLVLSTDDVAYQFISGPSIVDDYESNEKSMLVGPDEKPEARQIRYLAVDTQYFAIALLPKSEDFACYSAFGLVASEIPEKKRKKRTVDITYVLYSNQIQLAPTGESGPPGYAQSFEIFVGPKDPALLKIYGLQNLRTFGWFAMFSRPLVWLLDVFHSMTFGISYGLAIIMLTFLVRSLMIPISRKAALNAQMMQHLQPEFKRIADKYKDDMEKRAAAQRELMAKYNYNPLGGCLLMFLQLPIFIGLYRGLSVDLALRDEPLIPGLYWCSNLAAPDMLFDWSGWMPAFLASETGWLGPTFNLLPILTIVLFLAQQKLFMPPATDDQQKMVQRMMTFMMIFMGFIFFKVPSGLCVYFITSSIWGIMERKLLPKPQLANPPKFAEDGDDKSTNSKPEAEQEAVSLRNEEAIELRKRRDKERRKRLKERN